jgi:hypothetical protein
MDAQPSTHAILRRSYRRYRIMLISSAQRPLVAGSVRKTTSRSELGAKWDKRILVVAHDRPLRETRVSLLRSEGYRVESVENRR